MKKSGRLKGQQPKLPEPVRWSIRRRYAAGEVSLDDLATEYSVGRPYIHRIIHGPPTDPRWTVNQLRSWSVIPFWRSPAVP
ncbi:hypothetical protein GCM10009527_091780 [Actinomadura nitritigenes]|uniref:XRE family transcriptional regulator n=1 Tax=Actinomadura nitritigenes TaxID=134602 RepID=A0ABS3RE40_9ACTN|nr:hypothetical protein [Actinomadura nitritigenes]MBO2444492.1 hypothetical protein [Actinomadura nitritigenes]